MLTAGLTKFTCVASNRERERERTIYDYFRTDTDILLRKEILNLSRVESFHCPVFRRPRLVQLGAVNDDDAAIRIGYEGELVVGVAGVERDVVEKGRRPGHDALWERVDAQHSLRVDVEKDQFTWTCAVERALALATAPLVSHVLRTKCVRTILKYL